MTTKCKRCGRSLACHDEVGGSFLHAFEPTKDRSDSPGEPTAVQAGEGMPGRRAAEAVPIEYVRFIDVSAVKAQRESDPKWPDFHPERFCQRCGGRNVRSWYAASDLWNAVPDINIVCPECFTTLWEQTTGRTVTWEIRLSEKEDEAVTDEVQDGLFADLDSRFDGLVVDLDSRFERETQLTSRLIRTLRRVWSALPPEYMRTILREQGFAPPDEMEIINAIGNDELVPNVPSAMQLISADLQSRLDRVVDQRDELARFAKEETDAKDQARADLELRAEHNIVLRRELAQARADVWLLKDALLLIRDGFYDITDTTIWMGEADNGKHPKEIAAEVLSAERS